MHVNVGKPRAIGHEISVLPFFSPRWSKRLALIGRQSSPFLQDRCVKQTAVVLGIGKKATKSFSCFLQFGTLAIERWQPASYPFCRFLQDCRKVDDFMCHHAPFERDSLDGVTNQGLVEGRGRQLGQSNITKSFNPLLPSWVCRRYVNLLAKVARNNPHDERWAEEIRCEE